MNRSVHELNPALAALTGSGDWSLVKQMPPDAILLEDGAGRRWVVQAHLSRGAQDEEHGSFTLERT